MPVSAEGLRLPAALQALVGRDVPEIARLVVRLHEHEAVHRAASEAGLALVDGFHREAQVDAALEGVLELRTPSCLALAG